MLHNSELLLSVPTTIKNTSTTPDNSKELSKSSVSCPSQPQDQSLQGQIVQLKEKAHQSFMQVMYVLLTQTDAAAARGRTGTPTRGVRREGKGLSAQDRGILGRCCRYSG